MFSKKVKDAILPRRAATPKGLDAGLRHYERQAEDVLVRYHLRVEPDGSGLLLANASAACRLSPSGALIADSLLTGLTEDEIHARVAALFVGAGRETIEADVRRVGQVIEDMMAPGRRYPLLNLDEPDMTARQRALAAPLSAEIGIDGSGDVRARIDRLWEVGVPQIVFVHLPGAPVKSVVEGVERAEDHGMIAGVRLPASELMDADLLPRLIEAGVDHLDLYWAAADPSHHDLLLGEGDHDAAREAFSACERLDVCSVAVVPLVAGSLGRLESTLSALPPMGVRAVTLFALAEEAAPPSEGGLGPPALRQAVVTAEERADALGINLVVAPPVERDPSWPLAAQVRRGPRCAGEASIRVTPSGSVLPPHGPRVSAGNLHEERLEEIWRRPPFDHLREAVSETRRCDGCPGLSACAMACVADPSSWARLEMQPETDR